MQSHSKINEFLMAIRNGNVALVDSMVNRYGLKLLNSQDNFGSSALHIASIYGQETILNLLLSQQGINTNLQAYYESSTGMTYSPLDMAIKYHQPIGFVQLLLEAGATTRFPTMLFYMLFEKPLYLDESGYVYKIDRAFFELAMPIFDLLKVKIPEITYIDGVPLTLVLQDMNSRLSEAEDKVLMQKMIDGLDEVDNLDYANTYLTAKNFTHAFPSENSYYTINTISDVPFEAEGHSLAFAAQSFHEALIDYQLILNNANEVGGGYFELKKQVISEVNASFYVAELAVLNSGLYDISHIIYQMYNEGKSILLVTGWDGHAVDVILDKTLGLYVVANAGDRYENLSSGVNAYTNNSPVSMEDIYHILNNNEQYNLEYKYHYDLSLTKSESFSQEFPDQEYGNCALNSILLANWALLYISLEKKLNNEVLSRQLANEWSEDIIEHHKTVVLKKYLDDPYLQNDQPLYDVLINHESTLNHPEKILQTQMILNYLTSPGHISAFKQFYKKHHTEFSSELKHYVQYFSQQKEVALSDVLSKPSLNLGKGGEAEPISKVDSSSYGVEYFVAQSNDLALFPSNLYNAIEL